MRGKNKQNFFRRVGVLATAFVVWCLYWRFLCMRIRNEFWISGWLSNSVKITRRISHFVSNCERKIHRKPLCTTIAGQSNCYDCSPNENVVCIVAQAQNGWSDWTGWKLWALEQNRIEVKSCVCWHTGVWFSKQKTWKNIPFSNEKLMYWERRRYIVTIRRLHMYHIKLFVCI